jgi:hypothetical protein
MSKGAIEVKTKNGSVSVESAWYSSLPGLGQAAVSSYGKHDAVPSVLINIIPFSTPVFQIATYLDALSNSVVNRTVHSVKRNHQAEVVAVFTAKNMSPLSLNRFTY